RLVAVEDCWITEAELTAHFAKISRTQTGRVEIGLTLDGSITQTWDKQSPTDSVFSQVNSAQNERLRQEVIDNIQGQPRRIADLYAGYGNLTAPLAEAFPQAEIWAVELSEKAVKRGREELPDVHWLAQDVARFLKEKSDFPVIVLDPPRNGCDNAVIDAL